MTYLITKEIQFDAGHRVPLHKSKCRNPHGHRYRVVAGIEGELITEGSESGMVKDFSIVKQLLTEHVHDKFDHGFIVHDKDLDMGEALGMFVEDFREPGGGYLSRKSKFGWKVIVADYVPTAECLARAIFNNLYLYLPNLVFIQVWETPTSMAEYRKD